MSQDDASAVTRVLIVEDNAMNRDMLSRRLERLGFGVLLAHDGQEGLTVAASERPDVILMDVGLPVLDGLEATRRLKSGAATRAIPVIVLTAHAMSGDRERAFAAGCDEYDTKPIDFPRLVDKIRMLAARA